MRSVGQMGVRGLLAKSSPTCAIASQQLAVVLAQKDSLHDTFKVAARR
jgi:hypothetical protein